MDRDRHLRYVIVIGPPYPTQRGAAEHGGYLKTGAMLQDFLDETKPSRDAIITATTILPEEEVYKLLAKATVDEPLIGWDNFSFIDQDEVYENPPLENVQIAFKCVREYLGTKRLPQGFCPVWFADVIVPHTPGVFQPLKT